MGQTTFTGPVASQNGFIDSSFTDAERDALVDPQPGLLIWNTTSNVYQVCTVGGGTPTWDTAFGGGGGGGPNITSVSPSSGPVGTSVTITGTGFTGTTSVTFEGFSASFTVISDTTLTASSPESTYNVAVDVEVTTPAGSSTEVAAFTNTSIPVPLVFGISPAIGSIDGGTPVTISGADFTGATAVSIGGTAVASFSVVSYSEITAVTAARSAGSGLSVDVTTPGGTNVPNTLYTYAVLPNVTSISPASGPDSGGTPVTITGTGFTGAILASVGSVPVSSLTVVSDTEITATTNAGTAGSGLNVLVATFNGTSAPNTLWTYDAPALPTISSLTKVSGPITGFQSLFIAGSNFTGATDVTFSGDAANSFLVIADNQIVLQTAPHAAGATTVVVTTPAGSSTSNPVYTFVDETPTVTSISPASGPDTGGTPVTITGTYFSGPDVSFVSSVTIGGAAVASFTVVDATTITATTAAGAAGSGLNVEVVTTPAGTSAPNTLWTYTAAAPVPVLTSFTFAGGDVGGGPCSLGISGDNFTGTTSVTFNGNPSTFTVDSNNSISISNFPAGTAGAASIVATNANGASIPYTGWTYVTQPVITLNIDPNNGPSGVNTAVTYLGYGFNSCPSLSYWVVGPNAGPRAVTIVDDNIATGTTSSGFPPGSANVAMLDSTSNLGPFRNGAYTFT
jgi:hypothetical protein